VWTERAGRAAAAAVLLTIAALQVHRLDDPDTWWHLATGRLIVEQGAVPRVDPFSYTAPGAPWINRQWLFEAALYGSEGLFGESAGPALFAGALFFAAFLGLYVLARRRLPAWAAAALVLLASQAAIERFTVRPEAATLAFLAAYLLLLDGRFGARSCAALVGLAVVWANTHALSVVGLTVVAIELASALAAAWLPLPAGWRDASARPPDELRWLALATAGATLAEALTPFGLEGALYPLWLFGIIRGLEFTSYTIVEHLRTDLATLSPAAGVGLVAMTALAGIALLLSWRRLRLAHVALAASFLALAWLARRNVALVGFGLVPLVAAGLARPIAALDGRLARGSLAPVPAAVVALAAFVLTARIVRGDHYQQVRLTRTCGLGVSTLLYPTAAVDFLTSAAPLVRVFNDDLLGGLLMWRTQPPRPVFFDGRLQVYPESIVREFQSVLDDPNVFPELARRWGIGALLLHHPSPGRLEVAMAVARAPGWRVAHLDAGGVVLLADGAAPAPPPAPGSPAPAAATPGVAGDVERLLAAVRRPFEDAIAHYQRGRATLSLYGRSGTASAAADFRAALRLWPDFEAAAVGLQATGNTR
jgi:hypothetical protein